MREKLKRQWRTWKKIVKRRGWLFVIAAPFIAPPIFLWVGIGMVLQRTGQWMIDVTTSHSRKPETSDRL